MIERIIENWLINSTERIFQIPFCQILCQKGFKVIYISSHESTEDGKDIIAIDDKGKPLAYQLKTGNINTTIWRKIYGEIIELIELPVNHPSLNSSEKHRAFLVTNGQITGPVINKINVLNIGLEKRGLPKLELITGKELLHEFIKSQGSFLPNEPNAIQDFLELYLSNGKINIDEQKFASFINGTLFKNGVKLNKPKLSRKISSGLLLTKYALFSYERENNYISIIKGLVIFFSYVFAVVEKTKLPQKYWKSTYKLCWYEINENLKKLKEEVIERNNKFLEGDLVGDGDLIYKTRTTIILGWLSAYEILQKNNNSSYALDKKIYELVINNFPNNMHLWGESASVHFIMMGLFLSILGKKDAVAVIYAAVLSDIIKFNNNKNKNGIGLSSPYYSPDQILNQNFKLPDSDIDYSSFIDSSYTLKTLIECLVREDRRDVLEKFWYYISHTLYNEFNPEPIWGTYFWRCEKGTEIVEAFDMPQSWEKLKKEAFLEPGSLPKNIKEDKNFLILFLLTYPHRVKSDLVKLIDHNFH